MKNLEELKVNGNPLSKLPFKCKGKLTLKSISNYLKEQNNDDQENHDDSSIDTPKRVPFDIFGVFLETLMENEYKLFPYIPVPRFVRYTIQFMLNYGLNQEGIFRLPGESAYYTNLREVINKQTDFEILPSENPHNISSILKLWLRELKEPVLLFKNFDRVIQIAEKLSDENQVLCDLIQLFNDLPKENYSVCREFFRLMYLVSLSSEINRMDASNITKVFVPNLLYPKEEIDSFSLLTKTNQICDVLTLATSNYPKIFEKSFEQIMEHCYIQQENHSNNSKEVSEKKQKIFIFFPFY